MNPAGVNKPQHGEVVSDYVLQRAVKIRTNTKCSKAIEWFEDATLPIARLKDQSIMEITVPAGGVRIEKLEQTSCSTLR